MLKLLQTNPFFSEFLIHNFIKLKNSKIVLVKVDATKHTFVSLTNAFYMCETFHLNVQ